MDKKAIKNIVEQAEVFEKVAGKKDRPKGKFIFPADHPKVKDSKDHFPINTIGRARSAISYGNHFSKVPDWYDGTLQSLINSIVRAVKKAYPSIKISEEAKKPGKS